MMKTDAQNSVNNAVQALTRFFSLFITIHRGSTSKVMLLILSIIAASPIIVFPVAANSNEDPSVKRGEYIYTMGGCESCHADITGKHPGPAGGVALETHFGTFFTPNITPDNETGIGSWSDQQFLDAMRKGLSPDGEHYFPSFPYTSYTKMTDPDLLDLKAYLYSLKPVSRISKPHELSFPFNQRWLMAIWKTLFFEQEPFQPISSNTESWNRGAYIVNGPGHCAECHTPRNIFGGLKRDKFLAGTPDGPDGESVPSINPRKGESFKRWSGDEIVFALQTGMLPDGDFIGGSMGHVVDNSTSKLSDKDLFSISEYLQSPKIQESSGFFSATGGPADDAGQKVSIAANWLEGMLGDAIRWVIWLFLFGGVIWLVSVLLRSKRPVLHQEDTGDLVRTNHVREEIERDELMQQRREPE